jgi:hypothetical protein
MIKKFHLHINITPETTITNDESIVDNNKTTNKLLADAIKLEETGVYIGTTNGWTLDKQLVDTVLPKRPDVINIQDKKLYRWPHLDLPRQKVDLLKDKFNCKVIRNVDKADIEIISMNGMRKLVEMDWHASFSYSGMYNFLSFLKSADILTKSSLDKCRDILEGIPKESRISITRDHPWNIDSAGELFQTSKIINKYLDSNRPKGVGREAIVKGKDKIDTYHHIINTSSQVVFDVDINNIIDEDLAVIKNTELEKIQQMISSSDRDNRSLALEMLANCNVNKSFDVVSIIYYWYYDWLKDTNNWNTVNVKALKAKMKAFEGGGSTSSIYSYNNYIKNLVEHDKLTKFAIDDTRKRLYKHILLNLVGTDNEVAVFNVDIDSLVLKNELIENITND